MTGPIHLHGQPGRVVPEIKLAMPPGQFGLGHKAGTKAKAGQLVEHIVLGHRECTHTRSTEPGRRLARAA